MNDQASSADAIMLEADIAKVAAGLKPEAAVQTHDLAAQRTAQLLEGITAVAIQELVELRDTINQHIADLEANRDAIKRDIQHQAECAAEAMRFKSITAPAVSTLKSRIARKLLEQHQ